MSKRRAIIRMNDSVNGLKHGPIRENNTSESKLDLECLKREYPDFKEGYIAAESDLFFRGDVDIIFENGSCD